MDTTDWGWLNDLFKNWNDGRSTGNTGSGSNSGSFWESPQFLGSVIPQLINYFRNPDGYSIVTPPNDKRINDAKWNLIQYSPTRDYVSDYSDQAIQGLSSFKPDMHFKSNAFANEKPLAGYQPPNIDFSRLPQPWRRQGGRDGYGGTLPPAGGATAPPTQGGSPEAPGDRRDPGAGAPGGSDSPRDPFAGMDGGGGAPSAGGSGGMDNLYGRAINFVQQHPQIASTLLRGGGSALFAALGLPAIAGTAVGQAILRAIQSHLGQGQPQYHGTQVDMSQWNETDANGNMVAPRQNWTPNTGPGTPYDDFWSQQDANLRHGGSPRNGGVNDMIGGYFGGGPFSSGYSI